MPRHAKTISYLLFRQTFTEHDGTQPSLLVGQVKEPYLQYMSIYSKYL